MNSGWWETGAVCWAFYNGALIKQCASWQASLTECWCGTNLCLADSGFLIKSFPWAAVVIFAVAMLFGFCFFRFGKIQGVFEGSFFSSVEKRSCSGLKPCIWCHYKATEEAGIKLVLANAVQCFLFQWPNTVCSQRTHSLTCTTLRCSYACPAVNGSALTPK